MKLIDFLLRLYPGDFRSRYGKQMRDFHDQRVQENAGWSRIVGDHVSSALTMFATPQVQRVRAETKACSCSLAVSISDIAFPIAVDRVVIEASVSPSLSSVCLYSAVSRPTAARLSRNRFSSSTS